MENIYVSLLRLVNGLVMNVNMFIIVVYVLYNLLRILKDVFLWKFNVSYNYVFIYDYIGFKKRYVIR